MTEIITLCENYIRPSKGLHAAHGFSLFINHNNHTVLYDLGPDNTFADNARIIGLDVFHIDAVVLSHGHFDHAGGLAYYKLYDSTKVIVQRDAFERRYRITDKETLDIGIPSTCSKHVSLSGNYEKSFQIFPCIWCIVSKPTKDTISSEKGLMRMNCYGKLENDDFRDELNLALETTNGLYVISGCSHNGVTNIIDEAISATNETRVHSFIGGLHLAFANREVIENTVSKLKDYGVKRFVVGHCSGDYAINLLRKKLNNTEIITNFVGLKIK